MQWTYFGRLKKMVKSFLLLTSTIGAHIPTTPRNLRSAETFRWSGSWLISGAGDLCSSAVGRGACVCCCCASHDIEIVPYGYGTSQDYIYTLKTGLFKSAEIFSRRRCGSGWLPMQVLYSLLICKLAWRPCFNPFHPLASIGSKHLSHEIKYRCCFFL